jgi:hypothetical protein
LQIPAAYRDEAARAVQHYLGEKYEAGDEIVERLDREMQVRTPRAPAAPAPRAGRDEQRRSRSPDESVLTPTPLVRSSTRRARSPTPRALRPERRARPGFGFPGLSETLFRPVPRSRPRAPSPGFLAAIGRAILDYYGGKCFYKERHRFV